MSIKGIDLLIEDTATGAQSSFHQVAFYSAELRAGQVTAHVSSYVSEVKLEAGRNPLMQRSITLSGSPTRGMDTLDWIYTELVKVVPAQPPGEILPGMPMPPMIDMQNVFVGGVLVQDVAP
jgi:hypothetical protein